MGVRPDAPGDLVPAIAVFMKSAAAVPPDFEAGRALDGARAD